LATNWAGGGHWAQDSSHDFVCEARGFGLQLGDGLLLIGFDVSAGLLDLFLTAGASFSDSLIARLRSLLEAGFLSLENLLARFAETLFVIGSASLGSSNVSLRFLHRSLGAAAALGENGAQRTMDEERVEDIERC
jgi:hypothetical protein